MNNLKICSLTIACITVLLLGLLVSKTYISSIALNKGYIQCYEDNEKLWKKECNKGTK